MANENPVRFTLVDGTQVTVFRKTDDKYDFELKLLNGNRKTFMWNIERTSILNGKGNTDDLANEAVSVFRKATNDA